MNVRADGYYREALRWGEDDPAVRERVAELESGKKRRSGWFGKAAG